MAGLEAGERACVICGRDLAGHHRHARVCGGTCRAERSRLRRILDGAAPDGFVSLADYHARHRKRTDAALR
jgi:hypothetical protein